MTMPTTAHRRRIALVVANGSCAHCVRVIDRRLRRLDGIRSLDFDRGGRRVLVEFDPTRVSVGEIRVTMEGSGYPPRLLAHR